MDMDPYSSSGEKFNIKTRKPYTITKQRERWTEEEHNSFLEALKLYGRAWQRIEEHIGTKTAVQIRSHAQKFFTKLEKEAVTKGVPTRQALDMEIPPPRPKRKPNYPYPRKNSSQPTLESGIQILDLETKPIPDPETTTHGHEQKQKPENAKTSEQVENEEVACGSLSSENETCIRVLRDLDETNKSYITSDSRKHQDTSLFDFGEGQNPDNGRHNYPRHVPVQVVDGNQGIISGEESRLEQVHNPNPNLSVNNNIAAAAASCSSYQTIPSFHYTQENNYASFLHVSSTISSLIVSSLLQNPAAHAAASFAAKFWHPGSTAEAAASSRELENPAPPSMAAIAAATVAAATAWWAAHGLVPHPVCTPPPFPFGFGAGAPSRNEREKAPEKLSMEHDDTKEKAVVGAGKQVDRSSCGSNTTSSSEIETDALDKNLKEKEEIKDSDRSRVRSSSNTINPNESWKEVSEEGRLAFQALFSRQVLPQSFSDRHNNNNGDDELDLNRMSQQLTIGLGHTGFKPYKRCSVEAKDKTKIQSDDKGAKRMRFEASGKSGGPNLN